MLPGYPYPVTQKKRAEIQWPPGPTFANVALGGHVRLWKPHAPVILSACVTEEMRRHAQSHTAVINDCDTHSAVHGNELIKVGHG